MSVTVIYVTISQPPFVILESIQFKSTYNNSNLFKILSLLKNSGLSYGFFKNSEVFPIFRFFFIDL